ncbi:PAS domain S-box-containing protein [Nocardioides scoriae]|uniref:PAS domain S-box-containing protein n=1 Tax=Nocardioides scoriae TaxID=642780 RepID=A0A1H1WIK3_9ACTN|nr:GAF domain-containing protein [Nocardioides scoriae]SDS96822.1 PAS domain S-box-containing protein [Nocardioides scoriae]
MIRHLRRLEDADSVFAVLHAAPTPVIAVDDTGLVDFANSAALAAFGYELDDLLGRRVEELVPESARDRHVQLRAGYAAHPRARDLGAGLHLAARRRDGSTFPVEISLIPLRSGDGLWTIASVVDVSGRLATEERLRELGRSYQTLAELNEVVVRAGDEQALFAETCRVAVERGGYLGAWVGRADDAGRVHSAASAGALDGYVAALDISIDPAHPRGNGPTALALREGRPWFTSDFGNDEIVRPFRDLAAPYGIGSSATVPLVQGGVPAAVLCLYSEHPGAFGGETGALLRSLGENVSFALDGFAVRRQLEQLALERHELSERLADAQERERSRIAAGIHDDSLQSLAALELRLGMLEGQVAAHDPDLAAQVGSVGATLRHVVTGLRDLLFELEPVGHEVPSEALLRDAVEQVLGDAGVEVVVDVRLDDGPAPTLPDAVRVQALRILKEALWNVRHHAGARHVVLAATTVGGGMAVTLTDDGVGFDPTADRGAGHRGLGNMHDRAALVGGHLDVESVPGAGTVVRLWVPSTGDAPAPSH